jgi:hypothetical protein
MPELWYWIIGAVLAVAVAASFVRWFFIRPRRVKLPQGTIEELNRFAREFGVASKHMDELSKKLELRSLWEWQRKNEEILKTLRQMNRLLLELNEFFEYEASQLNGEHDYDDSVAFTASRAGGEVSEAGSSDTSGDV